MTSLDPDRNKPEVQVTFYSILKKTVILLCLIAFCCGVGKLLYLERKGFTIRRIAAPVQTSLHIWDSSADSIIEQPFYYLGRGRQCFAFSSLDGKYVLKLPRTDIYQNPFWMRALPLSQTLKENSQSMRTSRQKFVLNSMKIAYEELQTDTGVLAIHFGETKDQGKKLQIVDAVGYSYQLPAHKTSFVLQTKHPILMRTFLDAIQAGNVEKGKQILDALITVVVERGKKGIWNKDASFLRNYGFDGEKGYQIDIGSFYHRPNGDASIRDTMHHVRTWLETAIDPALLAYFDQMLEEKLSEAWPHNTCE